MGYSLLRANRRETSSDSLVARQTHGKKRKRRRRLSQKELETETKDLNHTAINNNKTTAAQSHWLIGYNVTTRHLESLARKSLSIATNSKALDRNAKALGDAKEVPGKSADNKPLAVVFAACSNKSSMLFDHLPYLIRQITLASPSSPIPRLVSLPKGAEERLGAALTIPRIGLLGLVCGNRDADFLIQYVRENVPEVKVPQIDAVIKGTYLPPAIQSFTGGSSGASEIKVHRQSSDVHDTNESS